MYILSKAVLVRTFRHISLNSSVISRSTLPSDAVEEFLSILRPSAILFPSSSPVLRSSNGLAHGFVPYRRPTSVTLSPAMSNEGLGLNIADHSDNATQDEMVPYPFKLIGSGLCKLYFPTLMSLSPGSDLTIYSVSHLSHAHP